LCQHQADAIKIGLSIDTARHSISSAATARKQPPDASSLAVAQFGGSAFHQLLASLPSAVISQWAQNAQYLTTLLFLGGECQSVAISWLHLDKRKWLMSSLESRDDMVKDATGGRGTSS
jgi:hypothetical protein